MQELSGTVMIAIFCDYSISHDDWQTINTMGDACRLERLALQKREWVRDMKSGDVFPRNRRILSGSSLSARGSFEHYNFDATASVPKTSSDAKRM